jgi:hypothetical protein
MISEERFVHPGLYAEKGPYRGDDDEWKKDKHQPPKPNDDPPEGDKARMGSHPDRESGGERTGSGTSRCS